MEVAFFFFLHSTSRATGGLWTDSARYCKGGRRRQPPTRLYLQWKEERFFRYPSAEIYTVRALFWSHYLRPRKCTMCVYTCRRCIEDIASGHQLTSQFDRMTISGWNKFHSPFLNRWAAPVQTEEKKKNNNKTKGSWKGRGYRKKKMFSSIPG